MKLTDAILKKWDACSEGVAWFNAQSERDGRKIVVGFVASGEHLGWANWLICRLFNRKQRVQYAIFAAEQVIDIFEKQYPDDKRPRAAIEAAEAAEAARAAAGAAWAAGAAEAAGAAAGAAEAAGDAAWAAGAARAAEAARAAGAAARAAAGAAARAARAAWAAEAAGAAAGDAMQTKILKYGLSLLEAKK